MMESNNFGFSERFNGNMENLSSQNCCKANLENFEFCGNSFFEGHRVVGQIALSKKEIATAAHNS